MITPAEETDVLRRAYVPEHIVSLMTLVSQGEPFLLEDHLGFVKDNWLILVGYPLDGRFSQDRCESLLNQAVAAYRPEVLWFIGPEIPSSFRDTCRERQSDQYYSLDIGQMQVKPALRRAVDKASETLVVERGRAISGEHQALISELLMREQLPDRVQELYRAMPRYVGRSATAWTIDARDRRGKLCAFSVIDLGAEQFSAYILGAHSKKNYVPHASDLLFREMIRLTVEAGKGTMNLGLGVNEGLQRFKKKWCGAPFLRYEYGERRYGAAKKVTLIGALIRTFATGKTR